MFFGHIAVGLAAKPVAPKASLGALLLSATVIDTLCGVFVITGIEAVDASGTSSIPRSHGLFMAMVWTIAGFAVAFLLSRDRRTGILIGLAFLAIGCWILSHIQWAWDVICRPTYRSSSRGRRKWGLGCITRSLLP